MPITFVDPDTRTLQLSGGDWLEVKTRLTYGAAQRLGSVSLKSLQNDGGAQKFDIDLSTYKIERMAAYIVDWSARTPDGRKVAVSRDAFAALDPVAAEEINDALDRHIEDTLRTAPEPEAENPTVAVIDSPSWSVNGSAGPTTSSSPRQRASSTKPR